MYNSINKHSNASHNLNANHQPAFYRLRMADIQAGAKEANDEAARFNATRKKADEENGDDGWCGEMDGGQIAEFYAYDPDPQKRVFWSAVFDFMLPEPAHAEQWRQWQGQDFIDFPVAWVLIPRSEELPLGGQTDDDIPF